MKLLSAQRIIKAGFTNYWRNVGLSLATTLILTVTLFALSVLLMIVLIGRVSLDSIQEKVDVSVYFDSFASEIQVQQIVQDVKSSPQVKNVEYLTKEQALENFKATHQDSDLLLQSLQELDQNPLSPTMVIKAYHPEDYQAIVARLEESKKSGVIKDITYYDNRSTIDRLTRIMNTARVGGLLVSGIFILITIIVIFNTIRLTIFSRQNEISIMKLVGATNWFIRWPFLIEGLIHGLFASMLGFVILFPLLRYLSPKVQSFFQVSSANIFDYFTSHSIYTLLGLFAVSFVLVFISSLLAIRRYLKV